MQTVTVEIYSTNCRFDYDWEYINAKIVTYIRNVNGVLIPYLSPFFFATGVYQETAPAGRKIQLSNFNVAAEDNIETHTIIQKILKVISLEIEQIFAIGSRPPAE